MIFFGGNIAVRALVPEAKLAYYTNTECRRPTTTPKKLLKHTNAVASPPAERCVVFTPPVNADIPIQAASQAVVIDIQI